MLHRCEFAHEAFSFGRVRNANMLGFDCMNLPEIHLRFTRESRDQEFLQRLHDGRRQGHLTTDVRYSSNGGCRAVLVMDIEVQ